MLRLLVSLLIFFSTSALAQTIKVTNGITIKITIGEDAEAANPSISYGRLTAVSGDPKPRTDTTGAGALYYTCYGGCKIALYSGSAWVEVAFTEIVYTLTGTTANNNYDSFVCYSGGSPTLTRSSSWATANARTDALGTQDGVTVLASDHTCKLVGGFRTTGTNQTEDSKAKRFVWSATQQDIFRLDKVNTVTGHSYGTQTWREWNGASGVHQIEFFTGEIQSFHVNGWFEVIGTGTGGYAYVSFSLTDATSEGCASTNNGQASSQRVGLGCEYDSLLGYNKVIVNELAVNGTSQFSYYHITAGIRR